MVDRNTALSHHFFEVPLAQWIGRLPSHAWEDHVQRIVRSLQHLCYPRRQHFARRLACSSRRGRLNFGLPIYLIALARQNPARTLPSCDGLRRPTWHWIAPRSATPAWRCAHRVRAGYALSYVHRRFKFARLRAEFSIGTTALHRCRQAVRARVANLNAGNNSINT